MFFFRHILNNALKQWTRWIVDEIYEIDSYWGVRQQPGIVNHKSLKFCIQTKVPDIVSFDVLITQISFCQMKYRWTNTLNESESKEMVTYQRQMINRKERYTTQTEESQANHQAKQIKLV